MGVKRLAAEAGDLILLQSGERHLVRNVLGRLRLEIGRPPIDEGLSFLWVVDFPMFESIDDDGNPVAAHHPFTMPHVDDVDYLVRGGGESLLKVRSQAYDLVLNGTELGGGSIRIHNREVQHQMFRLLGIDEREAEERFGFLLDAFRYGAPPHGGIALGVDRIAMLLTGARSLREVIAFPKTQRAQELMSNTPGPVDQHQLDELHIQLVEVD